MCVSPADIHSSLQPCFPAGYIHLCSQPLLLGLRLAGNDVDSKPTFIARSCEHISRSFDREVLPVMRMGGA